MYQNVMKIRLTVIMALLLVPLPLHAQNLLKNGDFSAGLEGWTIKTVGVATPDSVLKAEAIPEPGGRSGKSIRITDQDDKAGLSVLQSVPAKAGQTYTLSFMSRTTVPDGQKGNPGYAMIQFLDEKNTWLNNPTNQTNPPADEKKPLKRDVCNFAVPGKEWQAGTITATAPAGAVKMWIVFKAGNTERGTIDLSDAELKNSDL